MSIDVHSHLNTAVPQLFLDVRKGLSVLNEQRSKCMAQIVEAYTPQPTLLQSLVEVTVL